MTSPSGSAQPARALDLQEEELDRIRRPGDFEAAPGERAVLDLGALVIGDDDPVLEAAAARRPGRRGGGGVDFDEVRRLAIDRHLVAGRARPRAGDLRLVIAGDEGLAVADLGPARTAREAKSRPLRRRARPRPRAERRQSSGRVRPLASALRTSEGQLIRKAREARPAVGGIDLADRGSGGDCRRRAHSAGGGGLLGAAGLLGAGGRHGGIAAAGRVWRGRRAGSEELEPSSGPRPAGSPVGRESIWPATARHSLARTGRRARRISPLRRSRRAASWDRRLPRVRRKVQTSWVGTASLERAGDDARRRESRVTAAMSASKRTVDARPCGPSRRASWMTAPLDPDQPVVELLAGRVARGDRVLEAGAARRRRRGGASSSRSPRQNASRTIR